MFPLGHETICTNLKNSWENSTFSHAYLFSGPEQVGKKLTAIWFAQYMSCQQDKKPCGTCSTCKQIAKSIHPDFFLIAPAEGKKIISIQQIRELQKQFSFKPYVNPCKIAIIDQAEKLNKEAGNALLKLLEEPPKNSLLFLISSSPNKLLPTILSRVRNITFRAVATNLIKKLLQEKNTNETTLDTLVKLADGRIGWAIDMSNSPERFEEIVSYNATFSTLLASPYHERILLAEQWYKEKKALPELLQFLILWWQDLLYLQLEKQTLTHFSASTTMLNHTKQLSSEEIKNYLSFLLEMSDDQRLNINKRLAFENVVIQMPSSPLA